MNKEVKAKWIEALESGKYKQGDVDKARLDVDRQYLKGQKDITDISERAQKKLY